MPPGRARCDAVHGPTTGLNIIDTVMFVAVGEIGLTARHADWA